MESTLLCGKKQTNVNTRVKDRNERETMKEEKKGENGREVVKQYNIRQPLEHNNTERDKY